MKKVSVIVLLALLLVTPHRSVQPLSPGQKVGAALGAAALIAGVLGIAYFYSKGGCEGEDPEHESQGVSVAATGIGASAFVSGLGRAGERLCFGLYE